MHIQKEILSDIDLFSSYSKEIHHNVVTRNCPGISAVSKLSGDSCERVRTCGLSAASSPGCLITTSGIVYTARTCTFTQKENHENLQCICFNREKRIMNMQRTYHTQHTWYTYMFCTRQWLNHTQKCG